MTGTVVGAFGVIPGLTPVVVPAISGVVSPGLAETGRLLRFSVYPDVFTVMAALAIGYWYVVTRVGPARGEVTTRRQMVWWYASVLTMLAFAEWPIHPLAEHYSYAVHMVEHEVFVFAAAPMMLLGTPSWLMRWAVVERRWYGLVRSLTRPVPAGIFYTVVLLLTHWPAVVNESTHNELFHFGAHLVLFASGLVFWMPLINRMPEFARLSRPAKILYLFVTSIPGTLPTIMLVFSTHVLYTAYAGGPQYLGWSNKADQEMAGTVMGTFVTAFIWVLATYHFFAWYGEEQRLEESEGAERAGAGSLGGFGRLPDDLTWADVERELTR